MRKRVLRSRLLALWRVRQAQGVQNLKAMIGIEDSLIQWLLAEDAFMVDGSLKVFLFLLLLLLLSFSSGLIMVDA